MDEPAPGSFGGTLISGSTFPGGLMTPPERPSVSLKFSPVEGSVDDGAFCASPGFGASVSGFCSVGGVCCGCARAKGDVHPNITAQRPIARHGRPRTPAGRAFCPNM